MTFLAPTGSQWRTPQYGKSVIVSSWRGITRIQAWPRKRGKPKNKDQADRQLIFKLYQRVIKALGPKETDYERRALANHNRTHRGQRGSAAIRFRDWQTQRLYGRGIAFVVDSTLTLYPPAVSRDASFILDHVTADPGQLLQRSADEWTATGIPEPDLVLTAGAPGNPNTWELAPL